METCSLETSWSRTEDGLFSSSIMTGCSLMSLRASGALSLGTATSNIRGGQLLRGTHGSTAFPSLRSILRYVRWTAIRICQSDGDAILFKANDFAEPNQSAIFTTLFGRSEFAEDTKNLAAICKAPFDKIPTLEDFLARRNIPQVVMPLLPTARPRSPRYMSAYPVLDTTNYALCFSHVGDRVELIGRIVEVKQGKTRHGKPYVFINFGPWKGAIVKISIWFEGLAALAHHPDQSWVGRWTSIVGLMEPPYRSKRYKYSHLSISITQAGQLHVITESEAKFRLSVGAPYLSVSTSKATNNREILEGIRVPTSRASRSATSGSARPTANRAILQSMKGSQPTQTAVSSGRATPSAGHRQVSVKPEKGLIGKVLDWLFG